MAQKKRRDIRPTIYLDANIISIMFYRGRSMLGLTQRAATLDWWEAEHQYFRAVSSAVTEQELSAGVYAGQKQAVRFASRLPFLPITKAVQRCGTELIEDGVVPSSKPGDALHLALAVVHKMDYLISWNHAHLVNVAVADALSRFTLRRSYNPPILVSPNTIPQVRYGHEVRRGRNDS